MWQAVSLKEGEQGGGRVIPELTKNGLSTVEELLAFCRQVGFDECHQTASFSRKHLSQRPTTSVVANEMTHLREKFLGEAYRRVFLYIADEKSGYVDQRALFGKRVYGAFPSARRDIREAGNCLAAECATAAVFHLMRAAEVALRALAADRGANYPHSSVGDQQCGALIASLDAKLSALRGAGKALWPSEAIKTEQIRFYHAAVIELRSFNEAWRKHVCHTGGDSFYEAHQALSIFEHVRNLMRGLAVKVSESSATSEYWTEADFARGCGKKVAK
jgi:hypothetical protein